MSKPRMCPHCRAFIDPKSKVCEYCGEKVGQTFGQRPDPSRVLGGFISPSHYTTFIILFVNFVLFVATLIMTKSTKPSSSSSKSTRPATSPRYRLPASGPSYGEPIAVN